MIITGSTIRMASQHLSAESSQIKENLKVWIGDKRPVIAGDDASKGICGHGADSVWLSGLKPEGASHVPSEEVVSTKSPRDEEADIESKHLLLKRLIEKLKGTKINIITLDDGQKPAAHLEPLATGPASTDGANLPRIGFGLEYDFSEVRQDNERTSLLASGVIKTGDDQEINFQHNLNMTRAYSGESSFSVPAGDAVKKDLLGSVKSSGLYVSENETVGTIQQIDLAV